MNFEVTRVLTGMVLYARDVNTLMTLYDHIRVARALSGAGPWTDTTADTAEAAALTCRVTGSYTINGKHLMITLPDDTLLDHVFTTADPVSAADAASELNGASALLDCTTDAGALVVRTADTGTDATLQIAGGDACVNLGLALNDTAFGKDADVLLVTDQVLYSFTDQNGDPDWTYRYKFVDTAIPRESSPLYAVPGTELKLDLDVLAVGNAHIVDTEGRAASGSIAQVANRFEPPSTTSDRLVIGNQSKVVDRNGDVWFALVRGSKVEFWVAGTPLHRVIEVPDQAEFDMLDPALVIDDPWGIVVPPYTSLPRTTPGCLKRRVAVSTPTQGNGILGWVQATRSDDWKGTS